MRNISLIVTAVTCILLLIACKSNKYMEAEVHYILELSNENAARGLDATYQDYQISNVKRISKSKYQFNATFICADQDCEALELQFKADESVLKFMVMENKVDSVMTTKGSKAHRTGAIGSQGGQ